MSNLNAAFFFSDLKLPVPYSTPHPALSSFPRALFFSSSVLDILIARARSHEALRFKVVGDILASVILVAYLSSSIIWNFYPRSDLALVVLYLLRGLWDLRIWFEENYAD